MYIQAWPNMVMCWTCTEATVAESKYATGWLQPVRRALGPGGFFKVWKSARCRCKSADSLVSHPKFAYRKEAKFDALLRSEGIVGLEAHSSDNARSLRLAQYVRMCPIHDCADRCMGSRIAALASQPRSWAPVMASKPLYLP